MTYYLVTKEGKQELDDLPDRRVLRSVDGGWWVEYNWANKKFTKITYGNPADGNTAHYLYQQKARTAPLQLPAAQALIEQQKKELRQTTAVSSQPQKENFVMGSFKAFVKKHEDLIYTLVVVLLVDHFFLRGALRSRVEKLVTALLDKAESTASGGPSKSSVQAVSSS